MELWIDCSNGCSEELSTSADRIWKGDFPDVADILLEDKKKSRRGFVNDWFGSLDIS